MPTSPAPGGPVGPLAVLSGIASRLAQGGEIVTTVTEVIQRLREALGATEVSLWLNAAGGLRRSVVTGSASLSADDVRAAADRDGEGPVVAHRLSSTGHGIGVLAATGLPASPEARDLLSIVANLLAPELVHAEDVHRLTGEVARTARQVEAERRFIARVIDSLPLGLYVVDREYRVQAWNRNRETGYQGVSRDQVIGRPIFDVLHRQPAESLKAEFDEVFESGRIQQFNIESDASGARRTYRITKIPMRLNDGVVTHVIRFYFC